MRKLIFIIDGVPPEQEEVFRDFITKGMMDYAELNEIEISGECQRAVSQDTGEEVSEEEWSLFSKKYL